MHLADRANTRQPSSPHTERRGQTAEIGDFHNAFLYSCACSVSSMHTTGFPFGDRIRCTCQNKYRCTREPGARLCLIRHTPPQPSTSPRLPVQEAPLWPLNLFTLVEHVSPPANHEQLKWTKDDCGSRIAAYVIFIDKIRGPMNFIYLLRHDYPNFSASFFFFKCKRRILCCYLLILKCSIFFYNF